MDQPRASKGELLKTVHLGRMTSKCTWKLSLDLEVNAYPPVTMYEARDHISLGYHFGIQTSPRLANYRELGKSSVLLGFRELVSQRPSLNGLVVGKTQSAGWTDRL